MSDPSATESVIAAHQRQHAVYPEDFAGVMDFDVPWEAFRHHPSQFMHTHKPSFYSKTFQIGEYVWKVLFTVQSETAAGQPPQHHLSVFLDNTHVKEATDPWQCACIFKFELLRSKPAVESSDMYTFYPNKKGETDRGYLKFARFEVVEKSLSEAEFGACFTVRVSVKDLQTPINRQHAPANTRAATGFVGLKNQGATCYLNSFLQTLYHLPAFRSATYRLPVSLENKTNPSTSSADAEVKPGTLSLSSAKKGVAFNIAKLFYRMQTQLDPPRTTELTESFGWTRVNTLEQHDIEELARILLENLETKMKGTLDEKTISRLFTGKQGKFIKCRDVDYTSVTVDAFQDIHLKVRECSSLVESVEHELKKEELAGENKYHCVDKEKGIDDRYDADMGTEFLVLPPVLVMHLRRFEFNLKSYQLEKVNGYFAFPIHLDMKPFLRTESGPVPPYTGEVPDFKSDISDEEWDAALAGARDQNYRLHSVLVHSGHMHGGHYQAYISPKDGRTWFKFDDATVTEVSEDCAVTDHFGGKNDKRFWLEQSHKDTSAYMLLYVRDDMWDSICNVSAEIPEELESEFVAEDAATKEASRHVYFTVFTVDDIDQHIRTGGLGVFRTTPQHLEKRASVAIEKDAVDASVALARTLGVKNAFWPVLQSGIPNSDFPREPVALQRQFGRRADRTRHVQNPKPAPIPVFKVPIDETGGEGRVLVFVKVYTTVPAGRGPLQYTGHVFVDAKAEGHALTDSIITALLPGHDTTLPSPDVYVELAEGRLEKLPKTLVDGTILVLNWAQNCNADVGMIGSPVITEDTYVPTESEALQAEEITAREMGIDRTNIFWWRYKLKDLAEDAGKDVLLLKPHLNLVWAVKDRPPAAVNVIEHYRLLHDTHPFFFYELRDDGRKADTPSIVCGCISPSSHADFVSVVAPFLRHPPGNIRLWTLSHGRKDCVVPPCAVASSFAHKTRADCELGYELLSFPLSQLKSDDNTEMRIPFMSPKLKTLATVTTVVQTSQTVQDVLCVFRKLLNQKLDEKDRPSAEDELILVRLRDSRIAKIIPPEIEVNRLMGGLNNSSWDCRVEVKTPYRPAPEGVLPSQQLLTCITLIDIKDNRLYFHGTPFFLYVLPGETCDDIINAASARLCLTAEMKNSSLYSLPGESSAMSVTAELEKQGSTDAYHYLKNKMVTEPGYLPSLGVEKKRVQAMEKPIKIHN